MMSRGGVVGVFVDLSEIFEFSATFWHQIFEFWRQYFDFCLKTSKSCLFKVNWGREGSCWPAPTILPKCALT